jgi:bacteriorhodopsin
MLLSTITFIGLSWRIAIPKRLFYQITTYVTLISTFTYYATATGGGWDYHHVWVNNEHKHDIPDTHKVVLRQIFWARYVDWLLTTPLILFNLGALAGLSGSNILNTVVAATAMNFASIFSIYSHGSRTKWGWYAISWVSFAVVGWHLVVSARATAQRRGGQLLYNPIAIYVFLVWVGYLVITAVSDISRGISPNEAVIAYAVLDILAKPALGFWLALGHDKSSSAQVSVDGVWSEGFGHREGALRVGDRDGDA